MRNSRPQPRKFVDDVRNVCNICMYLLYFSTVSHSLVQYNLFHSIWTILLIKVIYSVYISWILWIYFLIQHSCWIFPILTTSKSLLIVSGWRLEQIHRLLWTRTVATQEGQKALRRDWLMCTDSPISSLVTFNSKVNKLAFRCIGDLFLCLFWSESCCWFGIICN